MANATLLPRTLKACSERAKNFNDGLAVNNPMDTYKRKVIASNYALVEMERGWYNAYSCISKVSLSCPHWSLLRTFLRQHSLGIYWEIFNVSQKSSTWMTMSTTFFLIVMMAPVLNRTGIDVDVKWFILLLALSKLVAIIHLWPQYEIDEKHTFECVWGSIERRYFQELH